MTHAYGERVHILADVYGLSLLAKLGHPSTVQPTANRLLERLYDILYAAMVNTIFPRISGEVETRMSGAIEGAAYRGDLIDPKTRVIFVGVARAGTLPAYQGLRLLSDLLEPSGTRVDHIYMQRRTDDAGRVVGVDTAGSKLGGDVDGAYVVFPDPMGATGSSISDAIREVKGLRGVPAAIICVHLIITPEYIRRIQQEHPDAHIFALRLDRGMSSPEVLASQPGSSEFESGLNEVQYIVPGAGGLGELINNSDS